AILYAALNGFLDDVELQKMKEFENKFIDYLEKRHEEDILESIRASGELLKEAEDSLKSAILAFKRAFIL
ncbi:F0F1 ATP synthase subunit alpha, partial [Candidatus Giovannonibacteria bacterium]|nr:F0F1 ATP synthase subunit alpha [Candidatus Giovannonibacteria bacterium]